MDSYDIDENDLVVDQGPEAIKTILNRLVRAVRVGKLEVLDDGSVNQTLVYPMGDVKVLKYRRLNGVASRASDKAKGAFDKDSALMGSLCNMPESAMAALDPVDRSVVERLARLFMVV